MVIYIPYLLSLIVGILYLPFLGNAFVSDDIAGILYHPASWNLITSTGWPMTIHLGGVLQYLTYGLMGPTPWLFRLTNIVFHGLCVVLVYSIITKLSNRKVGAVTSLIFAVHPIATESITWISGGVYALTAALFLASFWFYLNKKYRFSFLAFTFSLLVSEKSLGLFLIFFAYEWFWGSLTRSWKKLIPYLLVSIILIVFYVSRIGLRMESVSGSSLNGAGFNNPLIQIPAAISTYMSLLVWPKNLTLYHGSFVFSGFSYGLRAVVASALLMLTFFSFLKKKVWGFWLVWFFAALMPTLTPLKISWIVAERYSYLASIGIFVLLAIAFDKIYVKYKKVSLSIGIIILLAISGRTIARNLEWRSEDTLWPATLRESPQVVYSWNNMGDVYSRAGNFVNASEMFKQAILIDPYYADAYHNLGNSYFNRKMYKEAAENFQKAVSLNPNLWQSYQSLAAIADMQGNYQEALMYLEKALLITQNDQLLRNYEIVKAHTKSTF